MDESKKLPVKKGVSVLYSWKSAERIWKPKSQVWYLSYAVLFLLLILGAIRVQYYIMVVGLLAFMLLWFVQGTIAPWTVRHKITTKGIFTMGRMFRFEDIAFYWFARKKDQIILYLDFPKELSQARLTLLVENMDQAKTIFEHLADDIHYGGAEEVEYNFLARLIYGEYIPITQFVPDLDHPDNQ